MPNATGQITLAEHIKFLQSIPNPEKIIAIQCRDEYGRDFCDASHRGGPKTIKVKVTKICDDDGDGPYHEYEYDENGNIEAIFV